MTFKEHGNAFARELAHLMDKYQVDFIHIDYDTNWHKSDAEVFFKNTHESHAIINDLEGCSITSKIILENID